MTTLTNYMHELENIQTLANRLSDEIDGYAKVYVKDFLFILKVFDSDSLVREKYYREFASVLELYDHLNVLLTGVRLSKGMEV